MEKSTTLFLATYLNGLAEQYGLRFDESQVAYVYDGQKDATIILHLFPFVELMRERTDDKLSFGDIATNDAATTLQQVQEVIGGDQRIGQLSLNADHDTKGIVSISYTGKVPGVGDDKEIYLGASGPVSPAPGGYKVFEQFTAANNSPGRPLLRIDHWDLPFANHEVLKKIQSQWHEDAQKTASKVNLYPAVCGLGPLVSPIALYGIKGALPETDYEEHLPSIDDKVEKQKE